MQHLDGLQPKGLNAVEDPLPGAEQDRGDVERELVDDPGDEGLAAGGLLTRADVGRGRRATYSLTEMAIELVPVLAMLGEWGLRNRPSTPTLRVRAELLAKGGPALWEDFMAELRSEHLGASPPPGGGPTASERLAAAYAEAVAAESRT